MCIGCESMSLTFKVWAPPAYSEGGTSVLCTIFKIAIVIQTKTLVKSKTKSGVQMFSPAPCCVLSCSAEWEEISSGTHGSFLSVCVLCFFSMWSLFHLERTGKMCHSGSHTTPVGHSSIFSFGVCKWQILPPFTATCCYLKNPKVDA